MRSSYSEKDVILLLKDITGLVEPQPTQERERLIQSGRHYSEMLPIEYVPGEAYMRIYEESLSCFAAPVAHAVGRLADKIIRNRGDDVVLVSLARAGIPIGILVKRYLERKYRVKAPHYSISIIRDRGIDRNAMSYLLERYRPEQLLFVDGWIGKGAILNELKKTLAQYPGVSDEIAVVADPAHITTLYGTHEDLLIPSACLNSTVSGLVSRTFLRSDLIGEHDFHGAVYYENLRESDLSYSFIEAIEREFCPDGETCVQERDENGREKGSEIRSKIRNEKREKVGSQGFHFATGMDEVRAIGHDFGIDNMHLIKPGIGETTRVLLRRVPWKVLIDERYKDDPQLSHLLRLAQEKEVPVTYYPLEHYKCCGIIKKIADM